MNKTLIIGLFIFLICFFLYYKESQSRIERLASKASVAESQLKDLKSGIALQHKNLSILEKSQQEADIQSDNISVILRNHDLEELARRKPKLIENRINDAYNKIFSEISDTTR